MRKKQNFPIFVRRAFTLIELLIVISIIAILAAAIFVSNRDGMFRGKDAQIIQSVNQIMKAAMVDAVSTQNKFGNWNMTASDFATKITSNADCNVGYGSVSPVSQMNLARASCSKIVSAIGDPGMVLGSATFIQAYSVSNGFYYSYAMAWLPGIKKYFCIGSNGRSSSNTNSDGSGCSGGNWTCPGCANDPRAFNAD